MDMPAVGLADPAYDNKAAAALAECYRSTVCNRAGCDPKDDRGLNASP